MTKRFFHFSQNNSGGSFVFSQEQGITHHVVIEAEDATDANVIAIMKGLYFDGCSTGQDCSCCGDRWSKVGEYSSDAGDEVPTLYGEPLGQPKPESKFSFMSKGWMDAGRETAVHYADGRVEWFNADNTAAQVLA